MSIITTQGYIRGLAEHVVDQVRTRMAAVFVRINTGSSQRAR
jgi:hypothetical protein